jgi:hypothetical protein
VFFIAVKNLKYSWGILAAVFVSTNAEVWIVGSLSPWMITFLCLITLVVYLKPEVKPEKTILRYEEITEIDPLYPKNKETLVFPQ